MNTCIFIGRLTREPELKPVGDTNVCQFSIAVNRRYKTQAGEQKEEVNFFDMSAWDKGAESIAQYFKKGDAILVYCSAKQETWQDKETGKDRSKVSFRVERFEFLPSTGKRDAASEGSSEPASAPSSGGAPAAASSDEIPF